MIAACARDYHVIDEVGEQLGLKLSQEEVKQANVDAYIIERIKGVLGVLKLCSSESARVEYGTLLTALAPPRLAERDQSGMRDPG